MKSPIERNNTQNPHQRGEGNQIEWPLIAHALDLASIWAGSPIKPTPTKDHKWVRGGILCNQAGMGRFRNGSS